VRRRAQILLTRASTSGRADVALFALRVFIGCPFWFHVAHKLVHLPGFAEVFRISVPLAAAAAWTQVFGAVLLIGGLLTPLASADRTRIDDGGCVDRADRAGERFVDPNGHSWEAAGVLLERMARARQSPPAAVVEDHKNESPIPGSSNPYGSPLSSSKFGGWMQSVAAAWLIADGRIQRLYVLRDQV
jgi:hypothetical protein